MTSEAFGPYRLLTLLGRGGMGEVWRAVDVRKDREIALKVLGAWLGGDEDFAKRFKREAALVARLNAPNIIPVHDYGEIDGRLFIDMPLVDGIDLSELIGRDGPLPVGRVVDIVGQVANALTAAHRAGLEHRDVKPSNILVSDNGGRDHAYLIDFGISRAADGTRISHSGAVIGTPAYMAPERFAGIGDHRTDVYALGCVLFEALTGRVPYPAGNLLIAMNAHQNTASPLPSALRPDLPTRFDHVVARALAKDPDQRFPTATDLAAALRAPAPATTAVPVRQTATATRIRGPVDTRPRPVDRVLTGHSEMVRAVAATTLDGCPVLASAGNDGSVRVWDARTGDPVGSPIAGHDGHVWTVAFARLRGQVVVVSGGKDGTVRLFDPLTGEPVGSPMSARRPKPVWAIATAELDSGPVVIVASHERVIRVWDLATGRPAGIRMAGHRGNVTSVTAAVWPGARHVVVSGSQDRSVRIWDLVTGRPIGAAMTGHGGFVEAVVCVESDGRPLVVSGGNEGAVRLWDGGGRPIRVLGQGIGRGVWAVTTAAIGSATGVLCAGRDGYIRALDLGSGRSLGRLGGVSGPLLALTTVDIDGHNFVVSGGADGAVRVRGIGA